MKTFTLFSALCVPLFTAASFNTQPSESEPTLVQDLNKCHYHTVELKDLLDNVDGENAASNGQAVVDCLYKISGFVDAADQQICNIPEDGGPDGGDSIISAMDNYCDEYKDMIDTLGQLHEQFTKAGFAQPIRDALDHSQCSFQSFSNGLYDALPCRSDDIDDNVEDMNGKYAKVIKEYNGIGSRDDDDDDDDCGDDDDDADNDDDGGDDDDDEDDDGDDDDGDDDDDNDDNDNGEDDDNDGENGDEDGGDDNDDGDDDHNGDGDNDEGDDDDE